MSIQRHIKQAIIGLMKELFSNLDKRRIMQLVGVFLFGAIWLIAVRFISYKDTSIHYHANFAVFINDERLPFDNFTFYEEVQSCAGDDLNNPKIRVHMHDQVNHVVHVHDAGSTWGHLFANLNLSAGDTLFKTTDATYVEGVDNVDIRYLLNGNEVTTIANRAINSEDVLLISIGKPTDEQMQTQYSQIAQDAGEYNKRADPSACTGGKEIGLLERLKVATGLFQE